MLTTTGVSIAGENTGHPPENRQEARSDSLAKPQKKVMLLVFPNSWTERQYVSVAYAIQLRVFCYGCVAKLGTSQVYKPKKRRFPEQVPLVWECKRSWLL